METKAERRRVDEREPRRKDGEFEPMKRDTMSRETHHRTEDVIRGAGRTRLEREHDERYDEMRNRHEREYGIVEGDRYGRAFTNEAYYDEAEERGTDIAEVVGAGQHIGDDDGTHEEVMRIPERDDQERMDCTRDELIERDLNEKEDL